MEKLDVVHIVCCKNVDQMLIIHLQLIETTVYNANADCAETVQLLSVKLA